MVFSAHLSYFNELVGGPVHGHEHLLDSNIAWGQDLIFLKDWLNDHPEASPLHLASFGWVDPRLAGIHSTLPTVGPEGLLADARDDALLGPQPGWYAIDVNHLHSVGDAVVDEQGDLRRPTTEYRNYHYFKRFKPVATAGYSIHIYHITLDEVNGVRRELGMKELSISDSKEKDEPLPPLRKVPNPNFQIPNGSTGSKSPSPETEMPSPPAPLPNRSNTKGKMP